MRVCSLRTAGPTAWAATDSGHHEPVTPSAWASRRLWGPRLTLGGATEPRQSESQGTREVVPYPFVFSGSARRAQCTRTPSEPDRRSPCPPHLRPLPSWLHRSTAEGGQECGRHGHAHTLHTMYTPCLPAPAHGGGSKPSAPFPPHANPCKPVSHTSVTCENQASCSLCHSQGVQQGGPLPHGGRDSRAQGECASDTAHMCPHLRDRSAALSQSSHCDLTRSG